MTITINHGSPDRPSPVRLGRSGTGTVLTVPVLIHIIVPIHLNSTDWGRKHLPGERGVLVGYCGAGRWIFESSVLRRNWRRNFVARRWSVPAVLLAAGLCPPFCSPLVCAHRSASLKKNRGEEVGKGRSGEERSGRKLGVCVKWHRTEILVGIMLLLSATIENKQNAIIVVKLFTAKLLG
ncbi:uncharacterized protein LOC127266272 [Andrographis paniculata]|uniref:uncharacterized protein LOC127266272 n=1 Tax=Andrographis paniculata TaxID=175694 RepID=UPI0021E88C6C|nr:uncharacterized protein LOC127266272 [Andrographis paniculata]